MTYTKDEIDTNNLVDRYVQNRLTPEERARFEDSFMANPELLDELELASAFQADVKKAAAEDLQQVAKASLLASLLNSRALNAVLAVALIFLVLTVNTEPPEMVVGAAASLESVRSDDRFANRITLAQGSNALTLTQTVDGGYDQYRVIILSEDGQELNSQTVTTTDDVLVITLMGRAVRSGKYLMQIEGLTGDNAELYAEYGYQLTVP